MEPTLAQLNRISLAHYGINLNVPSEQPQASAADANSVPEGAANANPNPAPEDADNVVPNPPPRTSQGELNRLMQTLARETYSEVTSTTLSDNLGHLSKNDRNALRELANQAEHALSAIKSLTIRNVLDAKDDSSKTLFNDAAELQFRLANLLRETAQKDKYQTAKFDGYRQMLEDFSLKCDARGSEILTLYMEVSTFGESKAIGNDSQLAEANAGDLLKGMAGSMHGNDKSLRFKEETDAIESRLAQFAASTSVNPDDLNALLVQTEDLSSKLKANDVAETMDAQLHAQLTARLDALRSDVNARTARALKASVAGLFNPVLSLNDIGKEVEKYVASHKKKLPELHHMLELMNYFRTEGVRNANSVTDLYDRLKNPSDELTGDINKLYRLLANDRPDIKLPDEDKKFFMAIGIDHATLDKAVKTYQEIQGRMAHGASSTSKLSGEDVVNAFRQNSKLSLLLGTRIHGGNDANVNAQLCDENLIATKKLGSGAANTVYKMTYKMADGSTKDFVFKPDLGGRVGLDTLLIAMFASYKDTQQTVKLNTATCDIAESLGLGRLVGKNYATIHNGQYGLLMEMAPGSEARKISEDPTQEIRQKFRDREIVGKLAKELNDLRWLDIATGQGDRHRNNYLVDFGADGKTPKVTGIDNDLCLTPYLVGVGKFNVRHNNERFRHFQTCLRDACMKRNSYGRKYFDQNTYNRILNEVKSNNFVVDTKYACNELLVALRNTFGFHTLTLPKQMSRSLHDKLVSLTDAQISELANKLSQGVDNPDGVSAAVQRLKDLRQIANDYAQDGKIVNDTDWVTDPDVLTEERKRGFLPTSSRTTILGFADYSTASYLRRDFNDLIKI